MYEPEASLVGTKGLSVTAGFPPSSLIQKWLTKTWREFLIRKGLQKSPARNNKLFNSVTVVEGRILQSS